MDAIIQFEKDGLQPVLGGVRRRLRLRDAWSLSQRTLWAAAAAGLVMLLAGRFLPVEKLWLWALAPLAIWLAAMLAVALLRPVTLMQAARRADLELGLKERLSSSLALRQTVAPKHWAAFRPDLINRLHADAQDAARQIQLRRDFPLRWNSRPLAAAGLLGMAAVLLYFVPNPMNDLLAQRAAVRAAAEQEAAKIEQLSQEVKEAEALTPEEREELARRLEELARQLRANPGDLEEALADLARMEETLTERMDPNASSQQAALEALAAQLQSLAGEKAEARSDDMDAAAKALEQLAEQMKDMDASQRQALSQDLAQMAAQAAQSGDSALAQALAQMSQAAQAGDQNSASQAAQAAGEAMQQSQSELSKQAALGQALSQLQSSRKAVAKAGQSQSGAAQAQSGQGQSGQPGQGPGQSGQGQQPGQGQGQGQQGQGMSGGGTKARTLPPGTGSGKANDPQGQGQSGGVGQLEDQVYVPWERQQGEGEVFIPGQDSGGGQTEVREQNNPLPGTTNPVLMPYYDVYYSYLEAANQAMDQGYIPPGLKDYVREYFSQLEP